MVGGITEAKRGQAASGSNGEKSPKPKSHHRENKKNTKMRHVPTFSRMRMTFSCLYCRAKSSGVFPFCNTHGKCQHSQGHVCAHPMVHRLVHTPPTMCHDELSSTADMQETPCSGGQQVQSTTHPHHPGSTPLADTNTHTHTHIP